MSKELLETISRNLELCPICKAFNSVKVTGFVGKNLECTNCKAQWTGGTYDSGEKWLSLTRMSTTGLGSARIGVLYKPFPLEFWLDKNEPFQTVERYAATVYEHYKEFESYRHEVGKGEFKDSNRGLWFIGPTIDIVAIIQILWEENNGSYNVYLAIVDQTSMIKDKHRDKNDLFLYMISKKLFILSEETGIPIAPYIVLKGEKEARKVMGNWFYPFKDLDQRRVVTSRGLGLEILQMFSQMKPKKKFQQIPPPPPPPPPQ